MNNYLVADRLLQVGINMLLCYTLFSWLIEFLIHYCKIRNHRLNGCLRIIPLIRCGLEPLLFWLPVSELSMLNLNIFACSHPLKYYLLPESIRVQISSLGVETITGAIFLWIPSTFVYIGFAALISISLYRFGAFILYCIRLAKKTNAIIEKAEACVRPITNLKLVMSLKRQYTKILVSEEVKVPFACWSGAIILPKKLMGALNQEEFESIIAHELEHLRWYDTHIKLIYRATSSIIWWVPMEKWFNKLEFDQELACDRAIHQYELNGISLASALKKTAQKNNSQQQLIGTSFVTLVPSSERQMFIMRITEALHPFESLRKNKLIAGIVTVLIVGSVLIFRFVIC